MHFDYHLAIINIAILAVHGFAMLAAAVLGLIIPSVEAGGKFGIIITVAGIFAGAVCLNLIDRLVPHLHKLVGADIEEHKKNANLDKILLFVTAIAIHNLPEGIAAGVSFGTDDVSQAIMIAGGIALQNIPEGMVIIGPMLTAGISPKRTFIYAFITGLVEALGKGVSKMAEVGVNLVKGLWEGMKSVKDWLWSKVKNMLHSLTDKIKGFFGIHSPSRLFEDEIGANLAKGIGVGFRDEMPDVTRGMNKAMPTTLNTTNMGGITINVQGAPGQNVNELAEIIAVKLQDMTNRRAAVYA
mgnify:CR=1 FL=1